ncbi:unnamed protein product, partial [Prorocentrum cordatum]
GRLGPKSDVEYFEWVNEHFLISDDYHLSMLSSAGAFAVERHSENKEGRGSKASVTELAKSAWAKGIRQEMRSPPWLAQSASVGDDETFTALHWGALLTATKDCMLRDVGKTDVRVQESLNKKIKGCRLYSRRSSKGAAKFLARYGSGPNEAATPTTIIQVFGYTSDVQTSFDSGKPAMKWCSVMYKDSQKIMIDVGECRGEWVWGVIARRFRYEVVANKTPSTSFDRVRRSAADVVRILRDDHPEYIPDLVLLCMPRLLGNWEQIVEQDEKEAMAVARAKSFLSYLAEVYKPLARIDEKQLHLVGDVKAIALHGALLGSVKLRVKGSSYKTVKGFEGLRAAFIKHMTKRALIPRYSDPITDSCAEEAADVDGGSAMTEEVAAPGIDESKQTVEQIVNHLITGACITKPMAANLSAASALNQVMMASFKIQADQGGSFAAGGDGVQLKFFDLVIESVLGKYPDSWGAVAKFIAKAKPKFSACLKETALSGSRCLYESVCAEFVDGELECFPSRMVSAMRIKVCLHVCSSLAMQMCMEKGADGKIVPKRLFPEVFSNACSDLVATIDIKNLNGDITGMIDAAPSWQEATRSFALAPIEANTLIETHSPKQFEEMQQKLKEGLTSASNLKTAWPKLLHSYKIKLDKPLDYQQITILPAEKNVAVNTIMSAFNKTHNDAVEALHVLQNTAGFAMNSALKKYVKAGESIYEWLSRVMMSEKADLNNTELRKKEIQTKLNAAFAEIAGKCGDSKDDDYMLVAEEKKTAAGLSKKVKLVRNLDYFSANGDTRVWHLRGKVVDEHVASNVGRANLVDLGRSEGVGPRFFLDGSAHQSLKKSDACLGFLIRPAHAPPADSTAKKEAKFTAGVRSQLPVATRTLQFEDLEITLSSGEILTYKSAHLMPLRAAPGGDRQTPYRAETALDK